MRDISKLEIREYLIGQCWLILILESLMPNKILSKSVDWKLLENTMLLLLLLFHPHNVMNFSIKLLSISYIDLILFINNIWWCMTILSEGHFKIRHSQISNWSVLTKPKLWQLHLLSLTYIHFWISNAKQNFVKIWWVDVATVINITSFNKL